MTRILSSVGSVPPFRSATTQEWEPAVRRASQLVSTGADDQAVELLAGLLGAGDPATARPDHVLVRAAIIYARCVDPSSESFPDEVAWARYAYRTARTLYGAWHPASMEAIETLGLVLSGRDRHADADVVLRELIQLHLDRGDVDAHLTARVNCAAHLHDVGRCGDAIRQATDAWQQWSTRHDPAATASAPIALQLIGMLMACGRTDEALSVVRSADLHIPEDDEPASSAYRELLTIAAATTVLHRASCTRNRGRAPATDAERRQGTAELWRRDRHVTAAGAATEHRITTPKTADRISP